MHWLFYAIPLGFAGIILVAALYKYMQVREAANWPSVMGKVVVSTSEVRTVKVSDSDRAGGSREEDRNFANIVYAYEFRGTKHRNDRVSIGEDLGNFEVAETIAKYPVGSVVRVYVNPADPKTAVLERELPKGIFGCLVWMVVIVLGLTFGGAYGFEHLGDYIGAVSAKPNNVKAALAFGGFGVLVALFAIGLHRIAARRAHGPWWRARSSGRASKSSSANAEDGRSGSRMYQTRIAYSYRYDGIDYRSGASSMGSWSSTMPGLARKAADKFPVGKTVQVYVNPTNPSEATLSTRIGAVWIVWIAAFALWGVAYYAWQQ